MTNWGPKDKAAIEAEERASLGLEGMRADLDDPRGYGNCFVNVWKWLKGKLRGRTYR
jgi:hypothetical protein